MSPSEHIDVNIEIKEQKLNAALSIILKYNDNT
jgi:hypothetical protein